MNRMRLPLSASLAVCLTAGAAHAQRAEEARLASIEKQIQALQAELARVRRDLATSRTELRQARQTRPAPPPPPSRQASAEPPASMAPPPPPPPAKPVSNPGGVSFPSGRPTLTSDDGRYSVAVGLQLHYDVGGYFAGNRNPAAQPSRLNTFGENVRRARLPFVFKFDDFQVNITPDFASSPDGSPTLYEANINYSPKGTALAALTATFGYFKPYLTLGDSMSSNAFLFLERPSIVEASRNIAGGDSRASLGARWAKPRYFLAAYLTGAPYGSQTAALAQPQQTGATIRAAGRPIATDDVDLHVGFSASDAFRIQRTATGQTLTVQDRPELRIDTNRLVSTGALNARSAYTYGPEIGFRWRNFLVQGEYIRIGVDRTDGGARLPTPGLVFDGGYIEGSWMITGEKRPYSVDDGAFNKPKVERPFSLHEGGAGAFELVARYSHINLNDKVTRGVAASATGGVFGGVQDVYGVGLNWYPNDYLRLMLDYDIVNVDRLNAAGTTQIGRNFQTIGMRAQAAF